MQMRPTAGAIKAICCDRKIENPIFNIVNVKVIGEDKKIRLCINDGETSYTFVMLPNKYLDIVNSGELSDGKYIKVLRYCTKKQSDKIIIMLTEIEILDENNFMQTTEVEPIEKVIQQKTITNKPIIGQTSSSKTVPINLLNSYINNWTISGRCSNKGAIRTWSKASGDGKLFNFELVDETGDIKITAFNKEVDSFIELIELNKVYSISKGRVQPSKRQFNHTKADYEIILNSDSIVRVIDDDASIPNIQYDFVPINELSLKSVDSVVDIVAIAHHCSEISTVMSKTKNVELSKRDVALVDRSGSTINITLWGDQTHIVDGLQNPSVVIKGALVKEFQGCQLSTGNATTILLNSNEIKEALALSGWYESEGRNMTFISLGGIMGGSGGANNQSNRWNFLSEIASANNSGNKPNYFTVYAWVTKVKSSKLTYKACSSEGCNKKVDDMGNGIYRCGKCDKVVEDFNYRLLLQVRLTDATDSSWVTLFQDQAEIVLGKSAQEIGQLEECGEKEILEQISKEASFKQFKFKLRSKMETYNDEARLKTIAVTVDKIDVISNIERMIQELNEVSM